MTGNKPTLAVAESVDFPGAAVERLRERFRVILADVDRPALLRLVENTDVLWVRLRHRIDPEVFERANHLQCIASPTTGLNHIDLAAAAEHGVRVISLQGEAEFLRNVRATAEHTICLMLALLRSLPAALSHVQDGGWNRDLFKGGELHGRAVGVVGHGRLGRLVTGYLLAFGARVLTYDPHVTGKSVEPGAEWVDLPTLLRESEIVTLHVNLDPNTAGFFDRSCFELIRPGAYLVNTSRGELIDEEALCKALEEGRLRGAALDVLSTENTAGMSAHALVRLARTHPGVLITPHIGGNTVESLGKVERWLAERVLKADLASGRER